MKVLRKIATVTCIFLLNITLAHAARNSSCDKFFAAEGKSKGVVLLTHGANLRPEKMDGLAESFAKAGFDVVRPAFTGHCGDGALYLKASLADWTDDARLFYLSARAHANGKPIFLVAYSFSAPIFLSLGVKFDRYVLLAPALATKWWYPIVAWAARTFPDYVHTSKVPEAYRANAETALRPLLALDEFMQKARAKPELEKPTLVWIDKEDELVSAAGLETLAAARANWRIEKISVAGSTLPKSYHHLIIDEAAVGAETWARITKESAAFLGAK